MTSTREKITFYVSALLYVVFNLRLGANSLETLKLSLWQIVQYAPYVIGLSYLFVALLQYMAGGDKLPWSRRLRIFFALGMLTGLFNGIYEYSGAGTGLQ